MSNQRQWVEFWGGVIPAALVYLVTSFLQIQRPFAWALAVAVGGWLIVGMIARKCIPNKEKSEKRETRKSTIFFGVLLLASSVALFFVTTLSRIALPRPVLEALSFLDTGLLFFGALYLVTGLLVRRE